MRDLGEVNVCLLLKWWWKYSSEDKSLWKSVVCSRYGRIGGGWFPSMNHPAGVSVVWKDISQLTTANQQIGEFFTDQVKIRVGNRRRIKFWIDDWLVNRSLREEFPRLCSLSIEKEDSVQQMKAKSGASGGWQLQFRRNLLAWEEEELQRLLGLMASSPCLRDGLEDYCTWLAKSSERFTVASVWRWWVANRGPDLVVPTGVWVSLAPQKMQFICWLAWRGSLKLLPFSKE